MNELDCQKLLIDAVQEDQFGGRGLAFNNRFIVGVVDLLLKMPGHEALILEAKLHKFSPKTIENGYHIADLGVTAKQKMYLRDWGYAGMRTGVVSFLMPIDGNIGNLMVALYSYEEMLKRHWSAHTDDHKPLGGKSERFTNIREQLMEFANG